jgi:hypothetical protein
MPTEGRTRGRYDEANSRFSQLLCECLKNSKVYEVLETLVQPIAFYTLAGTHHLLQNCIDTCFNSICM